MNPGVILDVLAKATRGNKYYEHKRLYRNLYNKEFYLHAYGELARKEGNMTPGSDGKTIDGFKLEFIDKLIDSLKDESYQPFPASRTYIPKKNSTKLRPLGISAFGDKLVQHVVTEILNSIYEKIFLETSHGFRPNKSCHTALEMIKTNFQGSHWFIEGDIKGFFDNINHDILIELLRKRIKDEKLIRLIRKFLNAGYIENWKLYNTYSGTPQGGIISPILANIYLHELDVFMQELKNRFDQGNTRKRNSEYRKHEMRKARARKKLDEFRPILSQDEIDGLIKEIKDAEKVMLELPNKDFMDPNYKRLQYVRYADDFIIGVIGSKEDAVNLKSEIGKFINEDLKLELSEDKTLITNTQYSAKFLSYELSVVRNGPIKRTKDGTKKRTLNGQIMLNMPSDVIRSKLMEYETIRIINKPGHKEIWKAKVRPKMLHLDPLEIFMTYNAEIRGLYNYYRLANNVSNLHAFLYHMKFSLVHTLAGKYREHKSTIFKRFRNTDNTFGVTYDTKKGKKFLPFYNQGFSKSKTPTNDKSVDVTPNTIKYADYTSVVQRLLADSCEWCGATGVKMEIHHVKKLKDLKGKKHWEKVMIARKRKTMALCEGCHDDLHAGRLN
jgi:group II intron reverse transcriptase/maturase